MSFPAPKSIHLIATAAFWALAAIVAWGELGPGDIGLNVWDKLQHFGAYALLAGLATVALRARGHWLWALGGLIAFGGALEILQGMVGRDMSLRDEFANTLGVIAGGFSGWALCVLLRAWVVETPPAE
ncbi:MAG TPA: hypothetical protein VGM36_14945 [Rhizomicrobium sp.]